MEYNIVINPLYIYIVIINPYIYIYLYDGYMEYPLVNVYIMNWKISMFNE